MNWFKKNFEKFSSLLNNEEEQAAAGNTVGKKEEKSQAPAQDISFDNIEELKEVTISSITNVVRLLGYSNTKISQLIFHTLHGQNAVEAAALRALVQDDSFINQIKRSFKSKGIQYNEDLLVSALYNVPAIDTFTKITNTIAVEVLTPKDAAKKINGKITALDGITWEPYYILEPREKPYYIGRCKDPKIDNGPKITNDIAFIGLEEVNEEQYKVNSYVSRSHAKIMFDDVLGAFVLYRSKYLSNPSHKIKIFNSYKHEDNGISLNQSTIPHVLKDGDHISLNDTIVLEFNIIAK